MENLPADRAGLEFAHALLTADYLGRSAEPHNGLATRIGTWPSVPTTVGLLAKCRSGRSNARERGACQRPPSAPATRNRLGDLLGRPPEHSH